MDSLHRPPEHPKLSSLRTRSRLTIGFLSILGIVFGVRMGMSPAPTKEDIFLRGVLWAIVVVAWSSWLWRAYGNLTEIFEFKTKRSKTMAVAHHFIPLLNFIKPYEVFVEMWNLSAPPSHHQRRALLRFWWGAWLSCMFYFQYNSRFSAAMQDSISQTLLTVLDIGLFPAACALASCVIWSITEFQIKLGRHQEVARVLE